jgi:hypothetical protein
VISTIFDSDEFQFWGSESIQRGVPIFDAETGVLNYHIAQIMKKSIPHWKKKARELNLLNDGDQACFVLRRKAESKSL